MSELPRIALTVGDPAGIGPEIVRAVLAAPALRAGARLLVVGPASERPESVPTVAAPEELGDRELGWLVTAGEGWELGRVQESAGRAALAALRTGAELAETGLVTAPVSKEALHRAGEVCEGQTELLGRWSGTEAEMLAVAHDLRVLLLTRHMPLRTAIDRIRPDRVLAFLELLHDGLVRLGIERPRLALPGLNPHAGEAGLLGSEEEELLVPALEEARARGLDVSGPESPDTVYLRALEGAFDGVLALYHDQAFLPVKLAAPRSGLTVLLRLPYLRVSPAHGTAFDIAGTGRADASNLALAVRQAALWAPTYSTASARSARA